MSGHKSENRNPNSAKQILLLLSRALVAIFVTASALPAQKLSEYDVEAAYLYDFGKFVRWPIDASGNKTFDICILGLDPFGGALERLTMNDTIGGRTIHTRTIANPGEAAGCAIVYVADSEAGNLQREVAAFHGRQELLVSGLPHFLEYGGMIQFVLEEHRVRFAVNLDAASNSRLILSSDLLKVAVNVIGRPRARVTP